MNEDALNMEIRKFLKKVGITSQREIEKAITNALSSGKLHGKSNLQVSMQLHIQELGLSHDIDGVITISE